MVKQTKNWLDPLHTLRMAEAELGDESAADTSVIDAGRLSGAFSRQRKRRSRSGAPSRGEKPSGSGGASDMCAKISSPKPSATKGGRPQNISNTMQPNE